MALCALLVGALSAAAFVAPGTAPAADDRPLRLYADISERTLYVEGGNVEPRSYPIGVGTPEHPTPKGQFTIDKIIWNPAWVPPNEEWAEDETRKEPGDPENPMQAVKIFFDKPDYYIHGTKAPETVGTSTSHGCLRMHPSDAEELARIIMEHGGESRSSEWYQQVQRDDKKRTIHLPDPVPLGVTA